MNDKLVLKMERGRLVLEMPHNQLELVVNGELQAEYFLGVTHGPDDLREQLRRATAAHSACKMMADVVAELDKRSRSSSATWTAGFRAGLHGHHRVLGHDHAVACHVPPEDVMGGDGMQGWQLGYAIRAAIAISQTGKDPRAIAPEG